MEAGNPLSWLMEAGNPLSWLMEVRKVVSWLKSGNMCSNTIYRVSLMRMGGLLIVLLYCRY
jgi:hypothetical protein